MLQTTLEVEQIGDSEYQSKCHTENFRNTLYGGQVLAQALMAAHETVVERPIHSLHAYFLRAGTSDEPVRYQVEALRDGGSISSRRVVALQNKRPIFHLSASFHQLEEGYTHQDGFPTNIPSPDVLCRESKGKAPAELGKSASSPFDFIPIPENLFTSEKTEAPDAYFWVRLKDKLPSEAKYQCAALSYASDLGLLATAVLPHPTSLFSSNLVAASIDHALWFHEASFDVRDWHLFKIHSAWAGSARGFASAQVFDTGGRMIASTTQEGLIRPVSNKN